MTYFRLCPNCSAGQVSQVFLQLEREWSRSTGKDPPSPRASKNDRECSSVVPDALMSAMGDVMRQVVIGGTSVQCSSKSICRSRKRREDSEEEATKLVR